jgi:hypothetical protein
MSNALRIEVLADLDDLVVACLDHNVVDGRVRLSLVCPHDASGPILVRVRDPHGKAVVERLLRSLPMTPRLDEAISVPVAAAGDYVIELKAFGAKTHSGPRLDPWELDGGERSGPVSRAEPARTAILRAA